MKDVEMSKDTPPHEKSKVVYLMRIEAGGQPAVLVIGRDPEADRVGVEGGAS